MPWSSSDSNVVNGTINSFKKVIWYILLRMLKYVPLVQEACNEEVRDDPRFLTFIPDCFKTQEMCSEAVRRKPYML